MFKAELTVEDARAGMLKLQPKIERYADLIVRKGVNVEAGLRLRLRRSCVRWWHVRMPPVPAT